MAMDIVKGVGTGIVSQKATEKIGELTRQGPTHEENVLSLLSQIRDALSPKEKENKNYALALQPYPYEYAVDEDWLNKPHFCIFFHDATPLRFDVEGIGTYLKTVGPGWIQCDVRGRISTTDSQNHNVIISYREDALGSGL
jgi:hypothetical protein